MSYVVQNLCNNVKSFLCSHVQDISLTMMEEQLNGTYRAVFDGLASDEECKKLANLGLVRNMFDWSNHS